MIPQGYPLYARMWLGSDPTTVMTYAIIGWQPHPTLNTGNYIPIVAGLPDNSLIAGFALGRPEAHALHGDGIHCRWRITTNPHDTWKPTPGDGLATPEVAAMHARARAEMEAEAEADAHKAASLVQKGR